MGALALSGCGTPSRIGPPTDTHGGGWSAGCAHPDHPAPDDAHSAGGCGWVAPPGGFAYCHDYPGGIGMQLTCYSAVSGWVVNIPEQVSHRKPSAHQVAAVVRHTTRALVVAAGRAWYDSMPERTAETVCRAATTFFDCELGAYGVWFKRDGGFALYKHTTDPKTSVQGPTVLLYGSR